MHNAEFLMSTQAAHTQVLFDFAPSTTDISHWKSVTSGIFLDSGSVLNGDKRNAQYLPFFSVGSIHTS